MTLANALTSFRIAIIPLYAVVTYGWISSAGEQTRWIAFGLFLFLSVTDALDGALARWRNEQTTLGAWLDPIADKLLMMASVLLLAPSRIPMWFLFVWFGREVAMLLGAMLMHTKIQEIRIRPRMISKMATTLQFIVVAMAFLPIPTRPVAHVALAAAILTVASGLLYMGDGFKQVYGDERTERM